MDNKFAKTGKKLFLTGNYFALHFVTLHFILCFDFSLLLFRSNLFCPSPTALAPPANVHKTHVYDYIFAVNLMNVYHSACSLKFHNIYYVAFGINGEIIIKIMVPH